MLDLTFLYRHGDNTSPRCLIQAHQSEGLPRAYLAVKLELRCTYVRSEVWLCACSECTSILTQWMMHWWISSTRPQVGHLMQHAKRVKADACIDTAVLSNLQVTTACGSE